jgi:chromosome segregation ATPase
MLQARLADATKGAGIDRWEEGFDSWTPRHGRSGGGGAPEDTGVDLDREALLRLARELAERRHSEQEHAGAELERLKQSLRERAEAIAARERELTALQKRLGEGKPRRRERPDAANVDVLVARERAALERAQTLEARERELRARAADLEAHVERIEQRERELATELAQAQAQLNDSLSERELASAERAKLEERAEEARRVEKELAARRIELEQERERLETRARQVEARTLGLEVVASDPEEPPTGPHAQRESDLRRLEVTLAARERELALVRQGLDAERNALLERERALRRREAADVRQSFDPPLVAPSFSEGLAAFVSSRLGK